MTDKQTTKPETNYRCCVQFIVYHVWLAFSLEHNNIPEIFLPYLLLCFTVIKGQLIIVPQWNLNYNKVPFKGLAKLNVCYNEVSYMQVNFIYFSITGVSKTFRSRTLLYKGSFIIVIVHHYRYRSFYDLLMIY